MNNLLKNFDQTLTKTETPIDTIEIVELRNLNDNPQSVTIEFNRESSALSVPFPELNNDSVTSFPTAFSVCLQGLELDCQAASSTSAITIDTTKKYEININGVTTVLMGDALISYLESLPNIVVNKYL